LILTFGFWSGCLEDAPTFSGTICLNVEHHGVPISDIDLYRASGEREFIGFRQNMLEVYDTLVRTGLSNQACFGGLGLGQHQFAAEGYDPLIRDTVRGTLTLTLTVRNRTVDTIMPVSEIH